MMIKIQADHSGSKHLGAFLNLIWYLTVAGLRDWYKKEITVWMVAMAVISLGYTVSKPQQIFEYPFEYHLCVKPAYPVV